MSGNLFEKPGEKPVMSGRFARVALEQGLELAEGLTYAIPEGLSDLRVGDRVLVPLGRCNRPVGGYVLSIECATDLDASRIKPVAARDATAVNLPQDLVELAGWISRYYCCPLGMVFATMLPAAVKRGTGLTNRTYVELAEPIAPVALASIVSEHRLRGKQGDVLGKAVELAAERRLPILPKRLADEAGARSVSPVNQLVAKGLLRRVVKSELTAVWDRHAHREGENVVLNEDQRSALASIVDGLAEGFGVNLLYGVTGSGKTELYIRAIKHVVDAGKTAIVLVPEIALTPQTVGRFLGRFERVAVLHSGLTAAQRHEQWTLIRQGWAQVVVGARSAVFAPVQELGLIVVDEEHDASYKQDQAPRYHARDVAVVRARSAGAVVVLGSATPSLESYYNATERGLYRLLRLPKRVARQVMPKVTIVDLMDERRRRLAAGAAAEAGRVHLLSLELERALDTTLSDGGQAMLLLNRRGYANYIACPDHRCGWVKRCDHCDVNMVYHVEPGLPTGGLVRCHYCSYENELPRRCPACGRKVTVFGLGTQRVEDELARKFPEARVRRMDSDAMRSARSYEEALDAFRTGEVDVLVGTQMIAKGLDFPNVRLVGVISADTALSLPDFRAAERTFSLVCQVAGRSGRSRKGGWVIVQTFTPEHESIRLAAQHDFEGFARSELSHRRDAGLPPITRMARIVCRHGEADRADLEAQRVADALRESCRSLGSDVDVIGPAPAPIARIGGYHRRQVEVVAVDAGELQRVLLDLRGRGLLRSDAVTAVDVDPVTLL